MTKNVFGVPCSLAGFHEAPRTLDRTPHRRERFGFNNPVLISDSGEIIAGLGRVEAAKLLQMERVSTLRLSEAERRAYILADNKLAQNAGWDMETWRLSYKASSISTSKST